LLRKWGNVVSLHVCSLTPPDVDHRTWRVVKSVARYRFDVSMNAARIVQVIA